MNLGSEDAPLSDDVLNSAATVRDLANMGWIVSSNKTTDALGEAYKDTVKKCERSEIIGTGRSNGILVKL